MAAVLVTGFEPFAGREKNGSRTLVQALTGGRLGGVAIATEVFPVRWAGFSETIRRVAATRRPVLWLGLGEGRRPIPAFERVGKNRSGGPDVDGAGPPGSVLTEGGPVIRSTTMKWRESWFSDIDPPVRTSDDAGEYLCNSLIYFGLAYVSCPFGFVHLPVQGEREDASYVPLYLPAIERLIRRNLDAIAPPRPAGRQSLRGNREDGLTSDGLLSSEKA